MDVPGEDAVVNVQYTMVFKDGALIQAKAFTIDEELDQEPIGGIGKLLFAYGDIIEDTKEQCSRHGFTISLLKCATCTKITVANGIYGFLAVELFRSQCFWIKAIFTNVPEVHEVSLSYLSYGTLVK